MTKTPRKVQPAHKSENITVSQAARAWKKVDAMNGKSMGVGRSNGSAPKALAKNPARTKVAADRSKA
jgi:hypothetical protein